jgi:hypothetical protein
MPSVMLLTKFAPDGEVGSSAGTTRQVTGAESFKFPDRMSFPQF